MDTKNAFLETMTFFHQEVPKEMVRGHRASGDWGYQFDLSNGCVINFHHSKRKSLSSISLQGDNGLPNEIPDILLRTIDELQEPEIVKRTLRESLPFLMGETPIQKKIARAAMDTRRKDMPDFLRKIPVGGTISLKPRRRAPSRRRHQIELDRSSGWSQSICRTCERIAFERLTRDLVFEVNTVAVHLHEGAVRFERAEDGAPFRDLIWKNHDEEQYDSWDIELRDAVTDEIVHHFEVKAETPGLTEGELAIWERFGNQGFTALRVIKETGRVTQEIIRAAPPENVLDEALHHHQPTICAIGSGDCGTGTPDRLGTDVEHGQSVDRTGRGDVAPATI